MYELILYTETENTSKSTILAFFIGKRLITNFLILILILHFFLDNRFKGEKLQWGYLFVKQQTRPEQQDQARSPGTMFPTLCERCAGFFNVPC